MFYDVFLRLPTLRREGRKGQLRGVWESVTPGQFRRDAAPAEVRVLVAVRELTLPKPKGAERELTADDPKGAEDAAPSTRPSLGGNAGKARGCGRGMVENGGDKTAGMCRSDARRAAECVPTALDGSIVVPGMDAGESVLRYHQTRRMLDLLGRVICRWR